MYGKNLIIPPFFDFVNQADIPGGRQGTSHPEIERNVVEK